MLTMNYVAAPLKVLRDNIAAGISAPSERRSAAAFSASLHRLLAVSILAPHEVPEGQRSFARWEPKEYCGFRNAAHAATFFMLASEAAQDDARHPIVLTS